jgi:uncharacterized protein YdiU (UPF0061 family)
MAVFPFDNTYAGLPDRLYRRLEPTPVRAPDLVHLNVSLAKQLGLDPTSLKSERGIAVFSGNCLPEGADPLAQAYAGHQFGGFVPQLGDGRAILLGEVVDVAGRRRDIQLKGSGRTPFSRGGDGRAVLGPVLREYLVSEAMHALGIPTTRALAVVTTGEAVIREGPLPGAILTRVAASHIRVGTFEFLAVRRDHESLRALLDYAIARHYPEAAEADCPAIAFLEGVMERQAALVALWLGVGFIHGVMNTDNTAISGETIDYGPCAFMNTFDPKTTFSSIDHYGRYAYGAQPKIIEWNLARLTESLIPLIEGEPKAAVHAAQESFDRFTGIMESAWTDVMRAKLGLRTSREGDSGLFGAFLGVLHAGEADFTNTLRALCDAADDPAAEVAVKRELADSTLFDDWVSQWRARLSDDGPSTESRSAEMKRVNPAYIPRNHQVEAALSAAMSGDYAPFETLHSVLSRPYDEQNEQSRYREPPPPTEVPYQTFCGT